MMSPILIAALFATFSAPADRESRAADATKAGRLICRDLAETGSRLAQRRICMNRDAWVEYRRLQRAELERMQVNAGIPGVD